jgi:hypothetical protein
MKYIKLTQGKKVMVDNLDFKWLNQWKWSYGKRGYATRTIYLGKIDEKYKVKNVYMHRLINKTPVGKQTDHINRNKLDNQRKNLRTVSKSINLHNVGLRSTNTSGYKGVSFDRKRNRWEAYITVYYKKFHLGYFNDIHKAHFAVDKIGELYKKLT